MPPLNTFDKTAIALLLSQAAIIPAANAATINVGVGGAGCTLSDAIRSANQDVAIGSCTAGTIGADTISIPSQTITYTEAAGDGYQYGNSALPLIASEITIEGNGSTIEREVDGGATYNDFRIIATEYSNIEANLTLNSIVIANGYALYSASIGYGYGGGVYAGADTSVTINDSTIKDNTSPGGGGGVYGWQDSTIRINNTTISGNSAVYGGGVMGDESSDIIINESVITGNSAAYGGGLYLYVGTTMAVVNSTISNNTALSFGGGIRAVGGNSATVRLDVIGSTISDNTVSGVTLGGHKGGGISTYQASINITNSSISGNHANEYGSGLDINASTLVMKNTTVSNNSTVRSIDFSGNETYPTSATFLNTVVANSPGNVDCYINGAYVTLTTDTSNWIESGTCNSPSSGDPMLGPLADNGGLTYTHLPAMGSGLEGAGDLSVCGSGPVAGRDQRGELRGTDSCFIGAVEPFADGSINFFVVPLPSGKSVIFGL